MKAIIDILKAHSIEHKIENNKLEVKEEFSSQGKHGFVWVDATEWNKRDLFDWLGYGPVYATAMREI